MTIYIEYFLLQNVIINFCLIRLVYLTTKCKTSNFKMFLSSIVGACFSVISATFITDNLILNTIKLLNAVTIILVAFKLNKKSFIYNIILLFLYTHALGGIITSLSTSTYYTSFGIVTSSKINMWLVVTFVIALTYIFELVVKHIKFKIKNNNLIYKTTLLKGNKKITLNAFLDTGNMLNFNGNPVIIVDVDTYLKLNNCNLIEFLTSKCEELKTSTVTGSNKLKVFTIDELTIFANNKKLNFKNQYVAVNLNPIFNKTNYQALLSPLML